MMLSAPECSYSRICHNKWMSYMNNILTGMQGSANKTRSQEKSVPSQPKPGLHRSFTCKPQRRDEKQAHLGPPKPRACSTPASPCFRSQRRLSYQRTISRTGSEESDRNNTNYHGLSLSGKLCSIISIPCQVPYAVHILEFSEPHQHMICVLYFLPCLGIC